MVPTDPVCECFRSYLVLGNVCATTVAGRADSFLSGGKFPIIDLSRAMIHSKTYRSKSTIQSGAKALCSVRKLLNPGDKITHQTLKSLLLPEFS